MARRFARRPWGWWFVLLDRRHFKVKLLRFYKGKQLSLQWHQHRNELWLFLSGMGIISDNKMDCYASNTWTWHTTGSARNIFTMEKHTYLAERDSWILEIQYGEQCIEEDIVRV